MKKDMEFIQEQLWAAAAEGNCAVIRALVMEGADPEARDPEGRTAFNIATQFGRSEAATTILAAQELAKMRRMGLNDADIEKAA